VNSTPKQAESSSLSAGSPQIADDRRGGMRANEELKEALGASAIPFDLALVAMAGYRMERRRNSQPDASVRRSPCLQRPAQ
jgi:hypothetical protein